MYAFYKQERRFFSLLVGLGNLITKVTEPSYRVPRPAFQHIEYWMEIIHHAKSTIFLFFWILTFFPFSERKGYTELKSA